MRDEFRPLLEVPWSHRVELTLSDKELRDLTAKGLLADPTRLVYQHYLRNVACGLGLRVGAAHVFIEAGHDARPHCHLLLVGVSQVGKTLSDYPAGRIAGFWHFGRAYVQTVTDVEKAVGYLAKNCRQGKDSFNLSGHDVLGRWLLFAPKTAPPPQACHTPKETTPPWES